MKIKVLTIKKMIKILFAAGLLFAFAALPSVCIRGAQNGFKTAVFSVLPSILPFMILSKYIIGICDENNKVIKLLGKIFNIPPSGMYAVLFGSLSGYPTGAALVSDQIKKKD